jgi:hypothetical protein
MKTYSCEHIIHPACCFGDCWFTLEYPQLCDPAKIFHTSKCDYLLFFCNLAPKIGTANRWETTNSKSPRPIIMIGQPEIGSNSHIIFITLLCGMCTTLPCLLPPTSTHFACLFTKLYFVSPTLMF